MIRRDAITCVAAILGVFLSLAGFCDPQGETTGIENPSRKSSAHDPANSQEQSWKKEFERLCAETEIATTLPNQKIRELIRDSDILLEKLESLQGSQTKVYVFRLKKCKMFFEFALQLNETG